MAKRILITLLLIAYSLSWCYPQKRSGDEHLRNIILERGEAVVTINYPGRDAIDSISRHVSITGIKNGLVYINLSGVTSEWFIASGYDYSLVEQDIPKGSLNAASVSEAMQWDSYPTLSQYDSIMRTYANSFPSLCRLDTIGTSILGRPLLVLKISDNVTADEDEPEVFYTSTMHGNEIAGYVLLLRLAGYMLSNYHSDGTIRYLADNLEIWINPLANPDGTYNNGDNITAPVRNNSNGYDLNRNFPDPETPAGVIQKENREMIRFLSERRFVLSANFHTGAEVVNYPWDRWERAHADEEWFNNVSRQYADTVHSYAPQGYMSFLDNGVTRGYDWYQVYGGRQDYVTWELHGRELTIELDDDLITPAPELPLLWEYNFRSMIGYLKNALEGIHGYVNDSKTGEPVPAMIFIKSHDRDNSQAYSDTLTGRFARLVGTGSWDLTFTAAGYRDTTVSGVEVLPGGATILNVMMVAGENPVDTTEQMNVLLYPNPGKGTVFALLPEGMDGIVNIKIYSISGSLLTEYNDQSRSGSPLIINVSSLRRGSYLVLFTKRASGLSMSSRLIVFP